MKKNSKVIRKNYEAMGDEFDCYKEKSYYGVFKDKNRIKIDTKRFQKFFEYSTKECDFSRNTVYFKPYKIHRADYCMSYFIDAVEESKSTWLEQKKIFKDFINKFVQEQFSKKAPNYDMDFQCGILEADEWEMSNRMAAIMHQAKIEKEINSKAYELENILYSQTINMIASHLEHAMIVTMCKKGFNGERAGRKDIFAFMDGRIKDSENKIKALPHFKTYDMFYSIWNFIKHNSISTYDKVKKYWPELLVKDKKGNFFKFPNDWLAIEHLDINEKFFDDLFEPLLEFYFEFCELCYQEPKYYAKWNYDDFFIAIVERHIEDMREDIENPLGLPPWI